MSETRAGSPKSVPEVLSDLWALLTTYARQETIDPVKGLGRYLAAGVAGAVLIGLGTVLLALSGLRALQTETGTTFTGNLTWVPYVIVALGAAIVILLAVSRVGKGKGASR